MIVQGLVISQFDYFNALLLGVSDQQLSKLQKIQNMACHVINIFRKHDHVSNEMRNLHWLKIPECIQYKVLIIMYQCISDLAPSFITVLLDFHLSRDSLRSDTQGMLPIPPCSLSQVRDSSIRYAVLRLWNRKPQHIKNPKALGVYKTKLKTYLFAKMLRLELN